MRGLQPFKVTTMQTAILRVLIVGTLIFTWGWVVAQYVP
jgi:hypothetical protein